jgi:hypothetical protein
MSADRDRLRVLFPDFPQIGDRVSINILVTESASFSLASNRPDSQPHDPIVLTQAPVQLQSAHPAQMRQLQLGPEPAAAGQGSRRARPGPTRPDGSIRNWRATDSESGPLGYPSRSLIASSSGAPGTGASMAGKGEE